MARESDEPRDARPMSFFAAAAWTCGFILLLSLAATVTETVRPRETLDVVNATACIVLAYSALLFGMLRVHAPDSSLRRVLAFRRASPVGVGLAAAAGAALFPALALVTDWLLKRFPTPDDEAIAARMAPLTSMGERVVLAVSLALVIPFFEAVFYRGMMFAGLRRGRTEGTAVVECAALYAMADAHGDARLFGPAFVVGLLTGWLRGRSGSIVPALVAQVAYELVPAVATVMGKDDVDLGPKLALGGVALAALCTWGAGMIFGRDPRAEQERLLDE